MATRTLELNSFVQYAEPASLCIFNGDRGWYAQSGDVKLIRPGGSIYFLDLTYLLAVLASVGIRACDIEWDGLDPMSEEGAQPSEQDHLPVAPPISDSNSSAAKELLKKMVGRASAHLWNGYRLMCCAAPKYSDGGPDELLSARTLIYELAHLLKATNLDPSDDPPDEWVTLQAEVMAWRAQYPEHEYRRLNDCIAPKTWHMKR